MGGKKRKGLLAFDLMNHEVIESQKSLFRKRLEVVTSRDFSQLITKTQLRGYPGYNIIF